MAVLWKEEKQETRLRYVEVKKEAAGLHVGGSSPKEQGGHVLRGMRWRVEENVAVSCSHFISGQDQENRRL